MSTGQAPPLPHGGAKRGDRRVGRVGPVLLTGGMLGALEALVAISFAGLVFSGALATHVGVGIGLAMFSAASVLLVLGLRTSVPGVVGSVQDVTAVVVAVVAAGIVTQLGADDPRLLGTVIVAVALTTLLTGAVLYLIGRFRLGQLARLVPYPVIGGFLAGTGWLLVVGGVGVLVVDAPAPLDLAGWLEARVLGQLLSGVALALVLLAGVRRELGSGFVPGAIAAAIGLFYLVVLAGPGVGAAEAHGWLLGPFPEGALWPPDLGLLAAVDAGAIATQAPTMMTVVVLSAVTLLLNASGIELVLGRDVDLDRELRAAGAANLLAGAGGGLPGFHALDLTNLAQRSGATTRTTSAVAAGVVAVAMLAGGAVIGFVPRPVVGGMLVFLGLVFLVEGLVDGWRRLLRADYAVVVLIVVVIAAAGFLVGVAVGVVATIALFLASYSRTEVVRHELDGLSYPSQVDRPPHEAERLRAVGASIAILELQGFVFFGSANRLLRRIAALMDDPERAVRFVVVDLRRLTGLDSSTTLSFGRAAQLAHQHDVTIVLTGLRGRVAELVERTGLGALPRIEVHDELDRAIQWCEDRLLATAPNPAGRQEPDLQARLEHELGSAAFAARLLARLVTEQHPAGTVLIGQAEEDHDLVLVRAGTVTVSLRDATGHSRRLRTMAAGSMVGEIGFYLRLPRSASVTAETDVTISRVRATELQRLEREDPELAAALHRMLARHLATRLSSTLRTIEALGG